MSIVIKNGSIFSNGSLIKKNILIRNGKISKISSQIEKSDKVIDTKNKIILPGLIDCHVHMREPGLTEKEDLLTGSMAAAAGGVTSFIDMPNTIPPTISIEDLEEKRRFAKKSIVNYGFHFGSTTENIDEIKSASNIASVKVYMDYTTGDLKISDIKCLQKIFSSYKILSIHAENESIKNAVNIIRSIRNIKNRLYFCHISSKEELKNALQSGKKGFIEVTPHHLFLTTKSLKELGAFGEMKPNLKSKNDQMALWEGIRKHNISTIASDHAPHIKEEKLQMNYPFGVPGLETMLPLLLNAVNQGRIQIRDIVRLCCENPAMIFNIKNKGFIKKGYDADLSIVDLNVKKEVINDNLFTKCKWSPFNGWKLQGWPVYTIVNGNVVFDNGEINKISSKVSSKELIFN